MDYYCYFICLPTRGQLYVLSINKQRNEDYGGVRWSAVAALRTAPQFRNAVLKFYFFISDHSSCLYNSKIYETNLKRKNKQKYVLINCFLNFLNRTEGRTPTAIVDLA